jgi:glycosyltransferase involved in cell wall biosynthesis
LAQAKFVIGKMLQDQPLHGLTVCYFGHYDPDYPRHRVLKKALRCAGAEIVEVNDHSLGLVRYIKLFTKSLRCHFDLMIVAFPSHTDMPVARLACSLKRAPLIFDALISLYESEVLDRQSVHPKSLAAKKIYWIDKMACQLADITLLDCQASIRCFVGAFRLQEAKFRRLWVGADDDILKPSLYDLEKPSFTVFFTGSFIPLQGIEYIIHAAKILEQRGEDVQFVIVGAGQTLSGIADLVSDLGVRSVQFEGRVRFEELSMLMSQAHLCLGIFGTSAKAQHGIPNKVFFALATKRPVLTGDTPAMREIFAHGENIWLCPMGDAAALADAITELKQRPDLRAKIAQKGYELFLREFSINAIKTDIVAIVQELYGRQTADVLPPVIQN